MNSELKTADVEVISNLTTTTCLALHIISLHVPIKYQRLTRIVQSWMGNSQMEII